MSALELADKICEAIHSLPEEQLDLVLRFVQDLGHASEPEASDETVAPLYRIHKFAVKTGVFDLAHQHDHYLYRVDKQ